MNQPINNNPQTTSGILKRRHARRIAMSVIYAQTVNGDHIDEVIVHMQKMREDWNELPSFTKELCLSVQKNSERIESLVTEVLENWRLTRIAPVERALLVLGCTEIFFFPDIPPRVTINEYIELSKSFANENAPAFINGILDKLVQIAGKPDSGIFTKVRPAE